MAFMRNDNLTIAARLVQTFPAINFAPPITGERVARGLDAIAAQNSNSPDDDLMNQGLHSLLALYPGAAIHLCMVIRGYDGFITSHANYQGYISHWMARK